VDCQWGGHFYRAKLFPFGVFQYKKQEFRYPTSVSRSPRATTVLNRSTFDACCPEPTGFSGTNEGRMEGLRPARLRDLPSVDAILNTATAKALLERFGRVASTNAARAVLAEARAALQAGAPSVPTVEHFALQA